MYYFFLSAIVFFFTLSVTCIINKKEKSMINDKEKLTDDVSNIIKIKKENSIIDDEII